MLKRIKHQKILGFTLIEVLAVMAILAIVAIITLPIISGVIEKSRRNTFINSVTNGMNAIKEDLSNNDFKDFPENGILAETGIPTLENNNFIDGKYKSKDKDVIAIRVTDGRYCANGIKTNLEVVLGPCYLLDKTAPDAAIVPGTITSNSIQVIMNATDEESDIISYEFSIDNGKTWTTKSLINSYTFTRLINGTSFDLKARVTNENKLVTEKAITLKTLDIPAPTFTSSPPLSSWSRSKVVTINYPTRQSNFIYEYSTNNSVTWSLVPSGTTHNITFNANGNLTARIRDGYNTVSSTTLTITTIDASAPSIPTSTVRYDNAGGSVRGNSSAWTNRTLWWGSFSSSDTGSGINRYEYSSGCSGSVTGTLNPEYLYSSNKNATYCIRAVDNTGNVSGWSSTYYFRIDKTVPTCTSSGGVGGWTSSNVSIYGTCSDSGGSGCNVGSVSKTFTTTTNKYDSPGTVYDNASNSVSCPTIGIFIDKTPPPAPKFTGFDLEKGSITYNGCNNVGGNYADAYCEINVSVPNTSVYINHFFSTADGESGVNREQYTWTHNGPGQQCPNWFEGNCGDWLAGNFGTFSYTYLSARAIDNVGYGGYKLTIKVNYRWG